MTYRLLERGLWMASSLLVVAAAFRLLPHSGESMPPLAPTRINQADARPPAESLAVWAGHAAARNPFRLDRRPAGLRFGEVAESPQEAERPPRPELTLLGTTGGPPWQGALAGIPGLARTVVVRPGDRLVGFVIRSLGQDRVVVEGMDTVWTLMAKRVSP